MLLELEISDPDEDSFDNVCKELMAICRRLEQLLPDPTLSPEERVERLARVAPHSLIKSECMKTARVKLNQLRFRLTELVPSSKMTSLEKIEFLVKRTDELVPEDFPKFFMKLEKLGDTRSTDTGR